MNVSLSSTDRWGFPKYTENPKEKTKEYITQYGRALFSDIMQRGGSNWYHGRARYAENLAYARGEQGMERYKGYFRSAKKDGENRPWEKLGLKDLKIMPRYFRIVQDKLDQVQFDAICTPIDSLARDQKSEEAAKLRFLMQHRDLFESFGMAQQGAGIEPVPADEDELEQHLDTWSNQAAVDLEIKLSIALTIQNDWDQLDKELDADCYHFGACCFVDGTANGRHYIKRIDPRQAFIPPSRYEDHRDLVHAGYLETVTVSELRAEAGSELTEREYDLIINSAGRGVSNYVVDAELGDPRDSYKIEVFRFQFKSKNQYVAKKSKSGIVREKSFNYSPQRLEEGAEVTRLAYNSVYEGTIILNSEYSYGCRQAYHQKRVMGQETDCLLNIHAFIPNMIDGKGSAMAEEVQAPLDAINQNWIGLNHDIARATPAGYKYDFKTLKSIVLQDGAGNLSPLEIVKIHKATGDFYYNSDDLQGNQTNSAGVSRTEGGLPEDLERRINLIRSNIQMIEQITGINEVTAGNNPNPEMGKRVSELAIEASISSLTHLFRCKRKRFEALCKSLATRIRAHEKYKPITGSLVKSNGKLVSVDKNLDMEKHIFAVKIENRPSSEEWNRFYNRLDIALANKEITAADMAAIEICDNLKQAKYILSSRVKRNERQMQQQAMQNQAATFEGQAKAAQEAEAAKQQTLRLEYQLKAQFEATKHGLNMERDQIRYDAEYRNLTFTSQSRLEGQLIGGEQTVQQKLVDAELNAVLSGPPQVAPME